MCLYLFSGSCRAGNYPLPLKNLLKLVPSVAPIVVVESQDSWGRRCGSCTNVLPLGLHVIVIQASSWGRGANESNEDELENKERMYTHHVIVAQGFGLPVSFCRFVLRRYQPNGADLVNPFAFIAIENERCWAWDDTLNFGFESVSQERVRLENSCVNMHYYWHFTDGISTLCRRGGAKFDPF